MALSAPAWLGVLLPLLIALNTTFGSAPLASEALSIDPLSICRAAPDAPNTTEPNRTMDAPCSLCVIATGMAGLAWSSPEPAPSRTPVVVSNRPLIAYQLPTTGALAVRPPLRGPPQSV